MTGVLALALAAPAAAGTVRHAVVVGANDGGGVLEPLRYAESDAERLGSLLVELGDFDEELVTVLYHPTEAQLREALAAHAAIAEEWDDDLFLFYYSGHADAQGLRLGDERYYFEALQHDLRATPATVRLGVLDACRSGTVTRVKGADVTESILGVDEAVAEGEAWLTASAEDELAQESDTLRGGFYTHYLMSGLRGAADLSGDGAVELHELHAYTYDKVVESTGRTSAGAQHPRFASQLTTSAGLTLTNVNEASAQVVFAPGAAGLVALYRLPDKTELAEFSKGPEREMVLAVPPGRYLVRRRDQDQTFEASFGVSQGGRFRVEEWGSPVLQAGVARGGDPRVAELVSASVDYQAQERLGASPGLAGGASLLVPGAGQAYNRQYAKGLLYFGAVAGTLAGSAFTGATLPDAKIGDLGQLDGGYPMLGVALWGAAVADAAYNVHRREAHRPVLGGQVGFDLQTGSGDTWSRHAGFSADLMLRRGVSIGLDRVGFTPGPDGSWDLSGGTRMMIAGEGDRFRPHAVIGVGARHGRAPGDDRVIVTRTTFSAGGGFRYYVVPRYFLSTELRWENGGSETGWVGATGFGVHLGR